MTHKPIYSTVSNLSEAIYFNGIKILIPFFIPFVFGCSSGKSESKPNKGNIAKELRAEAIVVHTAPLTSRYQTSGTLLANEEIQVFSEAPGRITHINFKEGSRVRKGDLLVQLFDNDIRAQIQKLKVQKQLQTTTRQRQDELLAISGISKQEYDVTVTQIAATDADIAFSEAQLRRLQIRAPFDGIIGLRNVSVGAIVSPTSLITVIQQVNPLKLDFPVPEQYKSRIKTGDKIAFTITGNRDTILGTINAIQPGADATTRTITMRAIVPNPGDKLVPGAFANVYLTLGTTGASITIPSQSIIPTTRDKKVAVVRNGKAELVTIITGERGVAEVEILQGLKAGDTVLTTGIMQVKDGADVKVTKITAR